MRECPNCKIELKQIEVKIEGFKNTATSHQCKCGWFEFEGLGHLVLKK